MHLHIDAAAAAAGLLRQRRSTGQPQRGPTVLKATTLLIIGLSVRASGLATTSPAFFFLRKRGFMIIKITLLILEI
jgi:hypothetical protein